MIPGILIVTCAFLNSCAVHNVNVNSFPGRNFERNAKITVLEFTDAVTRRSNSMFNLTFPQTPGADFADVLSIALSQVGKFEVYERNQIGMILKEQSFQMSGAVDDLKAIDVGKLSGVDYVLIGRITDAWYGSDGITYQSAVEGSFKVIKVQTGQSYAGGTFSALKFTTEITQTMLEIANDIADKIGNK